jgi:MoaA/NifB/PqqE/SkfB family radical SAM enzyme
VHRLGGKVSTPEIAQKTAVFCNGFEGIVGKIEGLCREKFQSTDPQLIVYIYRPPRAFHVISVQENEVVRLQPQATVLRGARDCLALARKSYDVLVVSTTLGSKRTLLAWVIATLTGAKVFELNLGNSEMKRRGKIRFFGMFLSRAFSRRTLNSILLSASTYFKLPKILAYPVNMHVETVAVCNLKCPACATGLNALGRAQGFMDFDKYQRMIAECGPYLNNLVLHLYGEPLLHKQIASFIRSAKDHGVRNVEMSTNANITMSEENALKFAQSGLDTLIVSADGADEEAYRIYRKGGKLSMVVDFLKAVVRAKKQAQSLRPIIELQFIIMKHNIHQVQQARELFLSLGADSFHTKMFDATFAEIGFEAAQALLPEADADKSFKVVDGKLVSKFATDKNFCPFVWDTATLTWDGHMIPCAFDEKGSVVLGDTFHVQSRFQDVWNSKPFVAFRKEILSHRKQIPLCKDCPYV